MKTFLPISAIFLVIGVNCLAADSKRTAEYLLTEPRTHRDKEVTVDVAFVQPVKWASPLTSHGFYHAMTIDRYDKSGGGTILVAIDPNEAASFVRKYGTDFDGKSDRDPLRGKFVLISGRHDEAGIWAIDTTGTLVETLKARQIELPRDPGPHGFGPGHPPRRGPAGR